jgi:hypothetical protein
MVTPVIARRFLSTNEHTARGTVWKTVGLDCNDKHAHVPTADCLQSAVLTYLPMKVSVSHSGFDEVYVAFQVSQPNVTHPA